MRHLITACAALLMAGPALAADDFQSAQREFDQYRSAQSEEFEEDKKKFEAYRKKLLDEFEAYKAKAAKVWGKDDAQISTRKTWVDYDRNMTERTAVDFEAGRIKVEVAVAPNAAPAEIQAQLAESIRKLMTRPADTRNLEDILIKPDDRPKAGIRPLTDLVATPDGAPVTERNAADFARSVVQAQAPQPKPRTGTDGKQRMVVGVEIAMIPDHLKKRADRYRDEVVAQARTREILPELVFAVIETESYFNPLAQSHVPAFGLMQLVPIYGGREAYRFVMNRDSIPEPALLLDGPKNIALGAGYLHLLYFKQLGRVENPDARLFCAIAAYNTGPSNVLRTFAGKYERAKFGTRANWEKTAYDRINGMTPEQVFETLKASLPFEETRQYVQKVRGRMGKYINYAKGT